jgi:murE/murF fusion protein
MKLSALLVTICPEILLPRDSEISQISLDTRELIPTEFTSSIFIALQGMHTDGRSYVKAAVEQGIAVVIIDTEVVQCFVEDNTIIIHYPIKNKIALLASLVYQEPSKAMAIIGVTGTNGKTSTCYYTEQLLNLLGKPTAIIGTLGAGRVHQTRIPLQHTTPDACKLQACLAQLQQQGYSSVAIEVSSHALSQHRVASIDFDTVIFTNLGIDHLDYHGTIEHYWQAKLQLFTQYKYRHVIINIDDRYGRKLLEILQFLPVSVRVTVITLEEDGVVPEHQHGLTLLNPAICLPAWLADMYYPMQKYNILNAVAVALGYGYTLENIQGVLPQLQHPPGRMQVLRFLPPLLQSFPANFAVVIDYAHTPEALAAALAAMYKHYQQKVYCVFGCGGERDRSKRAKMLAQALLYASQIIITQDNSRSEDPEQIFADILAGQPGHHHVRVIADRALAIQQAIQQALQAGAAVLVAGKGHETYQHLRTGTISFSDSAVAEQAVLEYSMPKQVSTDTRTICPGDWFVALTGVNFDGHHFLLEAVQKGASRLVIAAVATVPPLPAEVPLVRVANPLLAYGQLAAYRRQQYPAVRITGVTGSCGKTTLKHMLTHVLSQCFTEAAVLSNKYNYNNEIGVPYTILQLQAAHCAAVVEMGIRYAHDLDYLMPIVKPNISVITCIAECHLETLGSLEGVAIAKGKIYRNLAADGIAIMNYDMPYVELWKTMLQEQQIISFALHNPADLRAINIQVQEQYTSFQLLVAPALQQTLKVGQAAVNISIPLVGEHYVSLALAVIASASQYGLTLAQIIGALATVDAVTGRGKHYSLKNGALLIDDSYNANPASMRSGIAALASMSPQKKKIMVMGDMLELGQDSRIFHEEIGKYARALNIDLLITYGELAAYAGQAFGENSYMYSMDQQQALFTRLLSLLDPNTIVLVKASNAMHMDQIVTQLCQAE